MDEVKHLNFVYKTIIEKVEYRGKNKSCPFCDRSELNHIIAEEAPLILLENKFPALSDTYQLVLIETDKCSEDITTYDKEHVRRLITFGTNHWLELESGGEFKSVVFFKNHGPLSGGSIDHAHMQIVGLKSIDYRENVRDEIFEGIKIYQKGDCFINVSTKPNACSTEINLITKIRDDYFIADNLPSIIRYILKQCSSYNLFFYNWNGSIICKVVSRWVTSPYLIGYSIPHGSDRTQQIAEDLKRLFMESPG